MVFRAISGFCDLQRYFISYWLYFFFFRSLTSIELLHPCCESLRNKMNSSWDFDSNFKDIVRFVDTLDEDTSPVTDSNGSSVTINQTIGFEESQSAYRSKYLMIYFSFWWTKFLIILSDSAVERLYPYYIGNVSAFKAQQDGDRNRECLDKQANVFIRSNPKEKVISYSLEKKNVYL